MRSDSSVEEAPSGPRQESAPRLRLDVEPVETHCPYCALQCGMSLARKGRSWEVGSRDFPVKRGTLCRKGWTAAELLDAPDRLRSPLLRRSRGEPLSPVSWDEAVAFIATLDDPKRFHGPKQVRSYLGLVPREHSSGEKALRGRITKQGSSRMRRLFVQAA